MAPAAEEPRGKEVDEGAWALGKKRTVRLDSEACSPCSAAAHLGPPSSFFSSNAPLSAHAAPAPALPAAGEEPWTVRGEGLEASPRVIPGWALRVLCHHGGGRVCPVRPLWFPFWCLFTSGPRAHALVRGRLPLWLSCSLPAWGGGAGGRFPVVLILAAPSPALCVCGPSCSFGQLAPGAPHIRRIDPGVSEDFMSLSGRASFPRARSSWAPCPSLCSESFDLWVCVLRAFPRLSVFSLLKGRSREGLSCEIRLFMNVLPLGLPCCF